MKNRTQILVSVALLAAALAFVGIQLRSESEPATAGGGMEGHDHSAMAASGGERNPVRLSPEDARRIGVTFATVERRSLTPEVEALGTVTYDETRLATVNPKVDGWVERLFVDFTGAPVERGQPLMDVYSPQLVSAQDELVLAAELLRNAGEGRASDNARALVESARRKLAYWDISGEEIQRIVDTGETRRTLQLRAPAGGVVVEKNVVEGDRITPGTTLYRIADLSRVWVEADIFEKDLGLVEVGQRAVARFEAFPGREFPARVTYIYPTVSMESRTGRLRLELSNPEGSLRPGMYARVDLDVEPTAPTLVVPQSALLSTGTRSLVFVRAADGALQPRDVVAGRTVGREVEVLEGLSEGDRVVSSAAFLVDAESNLGALTAGMEMDGTQMDGMELDGMEMEGTGETGAGAMDEMDHSEHGTAPPPDSIGMDETMDGEAADHDGHGEEGGSSPSKR